LIFINAQLKISLLNKFISDFYNSLFLTVFNYIKVVTQTFQYLLDKCSFTQRCKNDTGLYNLRPSWFSGHCHDVRYTFSIRSL